MDLFTYPVWTATALHTVHLLKYAQHKQHINNIYIFTNVILFLFPTPSSCSSTCTPVLRAAAATRCVAYAVILSVVVGLLLLLSVGYMSAEGINYFSIELQHLHSLKVQHCNQAEALVVSKCFWC